MGLIRYLSETEIPQLRDHLLRLEPEDRRMRFGGASLKPAAIEAYCDSIDPTCSLVIGFFADEVLRGVAQIAFLTEPARSWFEHDGRAEFAISVEHDWQNAGVGTRLFSRTVIVARNRNIRQLNMLCLPQNEKMKRLARKCGVRLQFSNGEVVGEASLDRPDALTLAAECFDNAFGLVDAVLDRAAREEISKTA